jgi:hypothetical protein
MLLPVGVVKLRKPSTAGFTASATAAKEVVVGGSLANSSHMSEARDTKKNKRSVENIASARIYCVCMQTSILDIRKILTKLNDHRCDNAEGIRTPSFGVLHAQLNLW